MSTELRDLRPDELSVVHAMNEDALPHVSTETAEEMEWYAGAAPYFRVAVRAGRIIGFLVAMTADTRYNSENFLWFRKRYPSFVYIDRVVVADGERGRGIGQLLYADVERFARPIAPLLTCEVNVRPRNDVSLRFHERAGFVPVGQMETEGGTKTVSFMTKALAEPDQRPSGDAPAA